MLFDQQFVHIKQNPDPDQKKKKKSACAESSLKDKLRGLTAWGINLRVVAAQPPSSAMWVAKLGTTEWKKA